MKKLTFAVLLAFAGCGDSGKETPDAPTVHEVDAAIDAPTGPDCFSGTPVTHDQLINACVDGTTTRIIKTPMLPLMNADGSLPPLP